jgi:hypothetical protein
MIHPNSVFEIYVTEKTPALPVIAAHRHPRSHLQGITSGKISNHFFNSLLDHMSV